MIFWYLYLVLSESFDFIEVTRTNCSLLHSWRWEIQFSSPCSRFWITTSYLRTRSLSWSCSATSSSGNQHRIQQGRFWMTTQKYLKASRTGRRRASGNWQQHEAGYSAAGRNAVALREPHQVKIQVRILFERFIAVRHSFSFFLKKHTWIWK